MKAKHFFLLLLAPLLLACPKSPPIDGILVFSKTEEFRHESIEVGTAVIRYMGKLHNFWVESTEDASVFNSENLKRYKAVVFLNTTGDILNEEQQNAFKLFINNGGGFVGIHSATDTEYDWPWYGKLVGAYFESHPEGLHNAVTTISDSTHRSTVMLPNPWTRTDEWYNFKNLSPEIKVLVQIDEKSYDGGLHGDFHPISWYQEYDGGKMFYTAMGHDIESYREDLFMDHILGGIQYVLGR